MAAPVLKGEVPNTRKASEDEQGNRTYTRVFQVEAENDQYGERQVAAALPFARGEPYVNGVPSDDWYESDPFAIVRGIEVAHASDSDDGRTWHCTVTFGSPLGDNEDAVTSDDPTLAIPMESYDSEDREVIVDRDISDEPIVNTAGDPFDPPVTRDVSRRILVIEWNVTEASFDAGWIDTYTDKKNSTTFKGRSAGKMYLAKITAQRAWSTVIGLYYKLRGEWHIDPNGWNKRPLNAGMREKVTAQAGVRYRVITGDDGQPVSEPVPLDLNGLKLPPDGTPIFGDFDVILSIDFNDLGV